MNLAQIISDHCMNTRFSLLFQVQAALKRQWNQYQAQRWSGRRRANRAANAAAATAAAAAALAEAPQMPVYICHQEPRNEPTNNLGEEGAEVTAMEGVEVIAMEGDEVIVTEGAEVIAMEIIEQESSAWIWRKYSIVITEPSFPGRKTNHAFTVISILPGANISFVRIIKCICP